MRSLHQLLTRFYCLLLGFGGMSLPLQGQFISTEHIFAADGYSVFEVGYPLKVAEGTNGKFIFTEFWRAGKEKRRIDNFYLESYGTRDYVEHWFKPVTNEGYEPMQVIDLQKLENCYAVIGLQYISEVKQIHTVSRFFSFDGSPKTTEPTQISTYPKRPRKDKGYSEKIEVSPKKKFMVWMGNIDEHYYFSVWDGNGNELWKEELNLPYVQDKYQIKDLRIDDKGNLYFLMEPNVPVLFRKGKKPLVLLSYLHEKKEFKTNLVELDGLSDVMDAHLAFLEDYSLVVAGVLSREGASGIRNGGKISETPRNWTHTFLKRYERAEDNWYELELAADSISPIPEDWIKYFNEEGSNFSLSRILVEKNVASIILEEHYSSNKKLYYYDLGVLGFNTDNGGLIWDSIVKKRQRDSQSNAFMSFVAGISRDKLRIVYLSERGAAGQLLCTSIDMDTGKRKDKMLASNEAANYLFFPARSGMVSKYEMVLIGMGNPSLNDFKLITISF